MSARNRDRHRAGQSRHGITGDCRPRDLAGRDRGGGHRDLAGRDRGGRQRDRAGENGQGCMVHGDLGAWRVEGTTGNQTPPGSIGSQEAIGAGNGKR
jgi:hypothetical protein